jgi:hypothetical protein
MKRFLVLLAVMALCAGAANAQFIFEHNNEIGIYTTQTPTAENAQDMTTYNGAAFTPFNIYVVVTNPFDVNNGQPISAIGGFEFHVAAPANVTVLGWILPPLTTNFATPPDFLAGSNTPVVDGCGTVLTINCFPMSADPGYFYLTPVTNTPQSVPDEMAITNYNNDFRISVVYPVSGAHDAPVFGYNTGVVPTEDASWGEVKSLFR